MFSCSVFRTAKFLFACFPNIDGCPLSPVLANIFMAKLEEDVVRPYNPPFYDRYVDDFSKKVGNNIIIIIAKYLSAHLKFSMRLQWEAKNLNYRKCSNKRPLSYKRLLSIKRPWCGGKFEIDAPL